MRIDFIFDTLCPWSFIAKRRLDKALRSYPDISFDINLIPFPLSETFLFPKTTSNPVTQIIQKTILSRTKLASFALQTGIKINFDSLPFVTDTSLSYIFIKSATQFNRGLEALDAVFTAFFCQGRNIGDADVLCDISDCMNMTSTTPKNVSAKLVLPSEKNFLKKIDTENIRSTPTLIFNEKIMTQSAVLPKIIEKMIETSIVFENNT